MCEGYWEPVRKTEECWELSVRVKKHLDLSFTSIFYTFMSVWCCLFPGIVSSEKEIASNLGNTSLKYK